MLGPSLVALGHTIAFAVLAWVGWRLTQRIEELTAELRSSRTTTLYADDSESDEFGEPDGYTDIGLPYYLCNLEINDLFAIQHSDAASGDEAQSPLGADATPSPTSRERD